MRVLRVEAGGRTRRAFDDVVAEEPLDIRLAGETLAITMRTPGDDFELAAGFLHTEGVLDAGAQIKEMRFCPDTEDLNTLDVFLSGQPVWHERSTLASSACGVCGKVAIEAIRRRLPPMAEGPVFPASLLAGAPEGLRDAQATFARTGGLHAAGLLTPAGDWLCVREDVGRHNAVDKVVGWSLLDGRLPLNDAALVVSGRAGFEIVQKAWAAGIPALVAVGAPTTLAVATAKEAGITLAGFARGGALNAYCGDARLGD